MLVCVYSREGVVFIAGEGNMVAYTAGVLGGAVYRAGRGGGLCTEGQAGFSRILLLQEFKPVP